MLSKLQTRKITRLFHVFDRDKDGVLTPKDPELFVEHLADLQEVDRSSEKYSLFREAALTYWQDFLRKSDLDRDGEVTLEEWLEYHESMLQSRIVFEATVLFSAAAMFMFMDSDGDGAITLEEYGVWLSAWGLPDEEINPELFARLDRNGNGSLSKEEVVEMTREFFYSDDPEAPGNWSMGPF